MRVRIFNSMGTVSHYDYAPNASGEHGSIFSPFSKGNAVLCQSIAKRSEEETSILHISSIGTRCCLTSLASDANNSLANTTRRDPGCEKSASKEISPLSTTSCCHSSPVEADQELVVVGYRRYLTKLVGVANRNISLASCWLCLGERIRLLQMEVSQRSSRRDRRRF